MNTPPPMCTKTQRRLITSYRNQAKKTLRNTFPRLSCSAIDSVLRSTEYNFINAFHSLTEIEAQRVDGDDDNNSGKGKFPCILGHLKVFIKNDRLREKFCLDNEQLIGEIDAIPELSTKEKSNANIGDKKDDGGADEDAQGGEMECRCCYGDYQQSDMRECKIGSGHYVCKQCIQHYVSEQLDGNGSTLFKCIIEDDCKHEYSTALLDQALTPKLNRRVNESVFREEMRKAGVPIW